jgi:hypothetical protein
MVILEAAAVMLLQLPQRWLQLSSLKFFLEEP